MRIVTVDITPDSEQSGKSLIECRAPYCTYRARTDEGSAAETVRALHAKSEHVFDEDCETA